ncbi:MAG: hypothetical protein ACD_47C00202G0001 [uncultured bacterium]|nr:MAG: hypothetical protein ACD_47C00202G0001 [uncultured bacterium]
MVPIFSTGMMNMGNLPSVLISRVHDASSPSTQLLVSNGLGVRSPIETM